MLPLGYNPDALIDARASREYDLYVNQAPNISEYPPAGFPDLVRSGVMPAAPEGLTDVHFTDGLGGLANEAAIKVALLKFRETHGEGIKHIDWKHFEKNDFSNHGNLVQNNV